MIDVEARAPFLSLVICTLDEADSIGNVLREVESTLETIPHETIVVDDSIGDATSDVVTAYALSFPSVRLLRRRGTQGLASAAIAGWDTARGDVLAIMDGDGQHDPERLSTMLRTLVDTKADIVVASRYMSRNSSGLCGWRHLGSRLATLSTFLMLLGVHASDPLSGFFLFRRHWYAQVRANLSGVGFKILVDMMASGHERPVLAEVQTMLRPRLGGQSKLDVRVVADLFALIVEKRTKGFVPAQFCLFAMIGSTGLVVHFVTLGLSMQIIDLSFAAAQAVATLTAMASNFFLNNILSFRDQRLVGTALWRGLLIFGLCCSSGAVLCEVVGAALRSAGFAWGLAGIMGAGTAAVFNYWAARGATWRRSPMGTVPPSTIDPRVHPAARLEHPSNKI